MLKTIDELPCNLNLSEDLANKVYGHFNYPVYRNHFQKAKLFHLLKENDISILDPQSVHNFKKSLERNNIVTFILGVLFFSIILISVIVLGVHCDENSQSFLFVLGTTSIIGLIVFLIFYNAANSFWVELQLHRYNALVPPEILAKLVEINEVRYTTCKVYSYVTKKDSGYRINRSFLKVDDFYVAYWEDKKLWQMEQYI